MRKIILTKINEPDRDSKFVNRWHEKSSDIAEITLQKPVRICIHASQMLPEVDCERQ